MTTAKFSIGVVIAIVLQVSGFVWWTAQQAQTIETLKTEVSELTAKAEIEKQVQLASDVKQLKQKLEDLEQRTGETFDLVMEDMNSRFQSVSEYVNNMGDIENNNNAHTAQEIQKLKDEIKVNTLYLEQIGTWAEEWDDDIDTLYYLIDDKIAELDKKLSDRIKALDK